MQAIRVGENQRAGLPGAQEARRLLVPGRACPEPLRLWNFCEIMQCERSRQLIHGGILGVDAVAVITDDVESSTQGTAAVRSRQIFKWTVILHVVQIEKDFDQLRVVVVTVPALRIDPSSTGAG